MLLNETMLMNLSHPTAPPLPVCFLPFTPPPRPPYSILFILVQDQIIMVGSEIGRLPPQFGDASRVANAILTCGFEFDSGRMYYNRYNSVVSYTTSVIPVFSQGTYVPYRTGTFPTYGSLRVSLRLQRAVLRECLAKTKAYFAIHHSKALFKDCLPIVKFSLF